MKISNIVARLTGIEAHLGEQSKAELSQLQDTVNGKLAKLEADLVAANASIESLNKEKADIGAQLESVSAVAAGIDAKLSEAISALKIEATDGMSAVEKISALESFAKIAGDKVGTPSAEVPAGGKVADKTMDFAAFNALGAKEKEQFIRTGGKIK